MQAIKEECWEHHRLMDSLSDNFRVSISIIINIHVRITQQQLSTNRWYLTRNVPRVHASVINKRNRDQFIGAGCNCCPLPDAPDSFTAPLTHSHNKVSVEPSQTFWFQEI